MTYTITIDNNGASDATGVIITDTFSADLVFKSVEPGSPACMLLINPGNQVVCALGQVATNSRRVVQIIGKVNPSALNDLTNQAITTSSTTDPNPNNNSAQTTTILDAEAPVANWFAPVFNQGHYWIGRGTVRLMVNVSDNFGISRVHFYRYDEPLDRWLDIGDIFTPPYEWYLDTTTLNPRWNEIDIEAYDIAGNKSVRQYIFIYKDDKNRIYMPAIMHK